jgi:hypothetical protein
MEYAHPEDPAMSKCRLNITLKKGQENGGRIIRGEGINERSRTKDVMGSAPAGRVVERLTHSNITHNAVGYFHYIIFSVST